MIGWAVIAIIILIAVVFIKVSGARHKLGLILIVVVILFLLGTASIVFIKNEVDLSDTKGFFDAVKLYFGLLGNGFQNLKTLAGNAIGMDWDDTNGTLFNKTELLPDKI